MTTMASNDTPLTRTLVRLDDMESRVRRYLDKVGRDLPTECARMEIVGRQFGPDALQGITRAAKDGERLLTEFDEVIAAVQNEMAGETTPTLSTRRRTTLAEIRERQTHKSDTAVAREMVDAAELLRSDLVAAVARRVHACRIVDRQERRRIATRLVAEVREELRGIGLLLGYTGDLAEIAARLEQRIGHALPAPVVTWEPPTIPDPVLRDVEAS